MDKISGILSPPAGFGIQRVNLINEHVDSN